MINRFFEPNKTENNGITPYVEPVSLINKVLEKRSQEWDLGNKALEKIIVTNNAIKHKPTSEDAALAKEIQDKYYNEANTILKDKYNGDIGVAYPHLSRLAQQMAGDEDIKVLAHNKNVYDETEKFKNDPTKNAYVFEDHYNPTTRDANGRLTYQRADYDSERNIPEYINTTITKDKVGANSYEGLLNVARQMKERGIIQDDNAYVKSVMDFNMKLHGNQLRLNNPGYTDDQLFTRLKNSGKLNFNHEQAASLGAYAKQSIYETPDAKAQLRIESHRLIKNNPKLTQEEAENMVRQRWDSMIDEKTESIKSYLEEEPSTETIVIPGKQIPTEKTSDGNSSRTTKAPGEERKNVMNNPIIIPQEQTIIPIPSLGIVPQYQSTKPVSIDGVLEDKDFEAEELSDKFTSDDVAVGSMAWSNGNGTKKGKIASKYKSVNGLQKPVPDMNANGLSPFHLNMVSGDNVVDQVIKDAYSSSYVTSAEDGSQISTTAFRYNATKKVPLYDSNGHQIGFNTLEAVIPVIEIGMTENGDYQPVKNKALEQTVKKLKQITKLNPANEKDAESLAALGIDATKLQKLKESVAVMEGQLDFAESKINNTPEITKFANIANGKKLNKEAERTRLDAIARAAGYRDWYQMATMHNSITETDNSVALKNANPSKPVSETMNASDINATYKSLYSKKVYLENLFVSPDGTKKLNLYIPPFGNNGIAMNSLEIFKGTNAFTAKEYDAYFDVLTNMAKMPTDVISKETFKNLYVSKLMENSNIPYYLAIKKANELVSPVFQRATGFYKQTPVSGVIADLQQYSTIKDKKSVDPKNALGDEKTLAELALQNTFFSLKTWASNYGMTEDAIQFNAGVHSIDEVAKNRGYINSNGEAYKINISASTTGSGDSGDTNKEYSNKIFEVSKSLVSSTTGKATWAITNLNVNSDATKSVEQTLQNIATKLGISSSAVIDMITDDKAVYAQFNPTRGNVIRMNINTEKLTEYYNKHNKETFGKSIEEELKEELAQFEKAKAIFVPISHLNLSGESIAPTKLMLYGVNYPIAVLGEQLGKVNPDGSRLLQYDTNNETGKKWRVTEITPKNVNEKINEGLANNATNKTTFMYEEIDDDGNAKGEKQYAESLQQVANKYMAEAYGKSRMLKEVYNMLEYSYKLSDSDFAKVLSNSEKLFGVKINSIAELKAYGEKLKTENTGQVKAENGMVVIPDADKALPAAQDYIGKKVTNDVKVIKDLPDDWARALNTDFYNNEAGFLHLDDLSYVEMRENKKDAVLTYQNNRVVNSKGHTAKIFDDTRTQSIVSGGNGDYGKAMVGGLIALSTNINNKAKTNNSEIYRLLGDALTDLRVTSSLRSPFSSISQDGKGAKYSGHHFGRKIDVTSDMLSSIVNKDSRSADGLKSLQKKIDILQAEMVEAKVNMKILIHYGTGWHFDIQPSDTPSVTFQNDKK